MCLSIRRPCNDLGADYFTIRIDPEEGGTPPRRQARDTRIQGHPSNPPPNTRNTRCDKLTRLRCVPPGGYACRGHRDSPGPADLPIGSASARSHLHRREAAAGRNRLHHGNHFPKLKPQNSQALWHSVANRGFIDEWPARRNASPIARQQLLDPQESGPLSGPTPERLLVGVAHDRWAPVSAVPISHAG